MYTDTGHAWTMVLDSLRVMLQEAVAVYRKITYSRLSSILSMDVNICVKTSVLMYKNPE